MRLLIRMSSVERHPSSRDPPKASLELPWIVVCVGQELWRNGILAASFSLWLTGFMVVRNGYYKSSVGEMV